MKCLDTGSAVCVFGCTSVITIWGGGGCAAWLLLSLLTSSCTSLFFPPCLLPLLLQSFSSSSSSSFPSTFPLSLSPLLSSLSPFSSFLLLLLVLLFPSSSLFLLSFLYTITSLFIDLRNLQVILYHPSSTTSSPLCSLCEKAGYLCEVTSTPEQTISLLQDISFQVSLFSLPSPPILSFPPDPPPPPPPPPSQNAVVVRVQWPLDQETHQLLR